MSYTEEAMTEKQPKTELFCILARNAPTAVIFRRGPSKRVLLIKWNLKNDMFEIGQWLKGRIYERRCDLSPKGEKLIYFAANWKYHKGPGSWTAISKPPYLSAVAMWPKGDGWGGGGLLDSELTILLNHREGEMKLADDFFLGKNVKVRPFGEHAGWGEDDPIYHTRLIRDGWYVVQEGRVKKPDWYAKIVWVYQEPRVYEKKSPKSKTGLALHMRIKGINEREKSWYLIDHEIVSNDGNSVLSLPRTSWADWDSNGDLLYADAGKLLRLPYSNKPENFNTDNVKEIADFNDLKFEEKAPPKEVLKW